MTMAVFIRAFIKHLTYKFVSVPFQIPFFKELLLLLLNNYHSDLGKSKHSNALNRWDG